MNAMTKTLSLEVVVEQPVMQAIVQRAYGPVDVLQLGDIARPAPREGEVLLRTHAAGLDRGTWHLMTGRPYLMRLMGFGFSAPKNPIAGLDVAGTVVALGPGVTKLQVGDEVFGIGQGSFAEYTCARVDKLARKPARLSFEEAAVLGVSGLTALQAVDAAGVEAGQHVLVVGASGGVGTYAVQLLKARGARVTAVASTSKLELVRSLGADAVVDHTKEDFTAPGPRYDAILDVGGNTPLSRLRRVLAPRGVLVFVGGEHGGDFTAGFERLLGAMLLAPFVKQRFVPLASKETGEGLERVKQLVDEGRLQPAVHGVWPLAQVPEAMRELVAGRVRGKVAISIR